MVGFFHRLALRFKKIVHSTRDAKNHGSLTQALDDAHHEKRDEDERLDQIPLPPSRSRSPSPSPPTKNENENSGDECLNISRALCHRYPPLGWSLSPSPFSTEGGDESAGRVDKVIRNSIDFSPQHSCRNSPGFFELSIKNFSRKKTYCTVLFQHGDTIESIKYAIEHKTCIKHSDQHLFLGNDELQNDRLLELTHFEYEIVLTLSYNMEIYVKNLRGEMIPYLVRSSDSLLVVRSEVWKREGMPYDMQNLQFCGHQLLDERTLEDYKIQQQSTLHLFLDFQSGRSCQNPPDVPLWPPSTSSYDALGYETPGRTFPRFPHETAITKSPTLPTIVSSGTPKRADGSEVDYATTSQRITVSIHLPSNKELTLSHFHDFHTIYDIKLAIGGDQGTPVSDQVLYEGDKRLDDCLTLKQCGFSAGACVDLKFQFNTSSNLDVGSSVDPRRLWLPSVLEQEVRSVVEYRKERRQSYHEEPNRPNNNNVVTTGILPSVVHQADSSPQRPRIEASDVNSCDPISPQDLDSPLEHTVNTSSLADAVDTSSDEATEFNGSSPSLPTHFTCSAPNCNKVFSSRDELWRHNRYHDRPEQCPLCKRTFGTKTHLNRHINDVHVIIQRFFCTVAGCKYAKASGTRKCFARKDNLRRHVKEKH